MMISGRRVGGGRGAGGGWGERSVGAISQTLLKGVFLFIFFIQNLGLACVGRHTDSCMDRNFKCRKGG